MPPTITGKGMIKALKRFPRRILYRWIMTPEPAKSASNRIKLMLASAFGNMESW